MNTPRVEFVAFNPHNKDYLNVEFDSVPVATVFVKKCPKSVSLLVRGCRDEVGIVADQQECVHLVMKWINEAKVKSLQEYADVSSDGAPL